MVNPEGYYTKIYMNMEMEIEMYGSKINMIISGDVGIADPGQPVVINVPNLSEYTDEY